MQVRRVALPYMMDMSFDYTERPWSIVLAIFDGRDILVERLWNPRTPLDSLIRSAAGCPSRPPPAGPTLAQVSEAEAIAIVGAKRHAEIEPRLAQTRADGGVAFAHAELQPGINARRRRS